ncbi:MAG: hypothetical protein JHC87_03075 [Thermoleophilaceae bacterium]|nr:hypothetical protein [Thermoleophilaceae bacterium]
MQLLPRLNTRRCPLFVVFLVLMALAAPPTAASAQSAVATRLDELLAAGQISQVVHDDAIANYTEARRVRGNITGAARRDLSYTIGVGEKLTRDGRLTGDRVLPVFLIMKRNAKWFDDGNAPAPYATRRRFGKSRIYFEYFPGCGWQIHPLANFSKLNGIWYDKSDRARRALGEYGHELLGMAVNRGGFMTWEYYFTFQGGRPPWISSIAQGTALQSLSRAGDALSDPALTDAASSALGAFETKAPTGLAVDADGGSHYLLYSFAPRFHVLNAFIQSLVGLNDYNAHTQDERSTKIFKAGIAAAKVETKESDTGAWSLYSVGGKESTLPYHDLLAGFLTTLCDRGGGEIFCSTGKRFMAYRTEKPEIKRVTARVKGKRVLVWFTLSKVSKVTVSAKRASKAASVAQASVGHGKRRFSIAKPRKAGTYTITVLATDLAGNSNSSIVKLKIKKTKKAK